jgi:hypothetical protein
MNRIIRIFPLALALAVAAAGCGPALGLLSKTTEGTSVRDVSGSPDAIRAGARLAILSPFPKTDEAFRIVPGDDERNFAEAFKRLHLFEAETARTGAAGPEAARAFAGKSPAAVKAELGLSAEPEILLGGILLKRKTYVAPLRGVVMAVSWRLTFVDLKSGKEWTVEVETKELAEETIPRAAERIAERIRR